MAEPGKPGPLRAYSTRQAEKRAALAGQSWREFFRGIAIEVGVVTILVIVALVLVLVLR